MSWLDTTLLIEEMSIICTDLNDHILSLSLSLYFPFSYFALSFFFQTIFVCRKQTILIDSARTD